MNEERSERLRTILEARRHELEVVLERQFGEQIGEDVLSALDEAIEVGDRAVLVHGQDVDLGILAIKRKEIRQVDEALARLGRGDYGLCEDCEAPIEGDRLTILPFATLCVPCKQRRELDERYLEMTGRGFRAGFRDVREAAEEEDDID